PLKYFRPVERQDTVAIAASDDHFLVSRVQSDARGPDAGDLLNRYSPSRGNVAFVIDTPYTDRSAGTTADNPALLVVNMRRAPAAEGGVGAGEGGGGFVFPVGFSKKKKKKTATAALAAARDHQDIVNAIDANARMAARSASDLSVWAGENPKWGNVAVRFTGKYEDFISGDGDVDLTVNLVEGHLVVAVVVRPLYLRMRSLDDANGCFFTIRCSTKCQNRLGQRAIHDDFIMNGIVGQRVHRPADESLLSFQGPYGQRVLFRQP